MSTFWKKTLGTLTTVALLPTSVIVSSFESLTTDKSFSESMDSHDNDYQRIIETAERFGEENGHLIDHSIMHVAKHLLGKK